MNLVCFTGIKVTLIYYYQGCEAGAATRTGRLRLQLRRRLAPTPDTDGLQTKFAQNLRFVMKTKYTKQDAIVRVSFQLYIR